MKNIVLFFLGIFLLSFFSGCIMENRFEGLAPGKWRVMLLLDGRKNQQLKRNKRDKYQLVIDDKLIYEEVTAGELPFTWDVIHTSATDFYIEIINGEERITVPQENISYGKDRTNGHDTIRIDFPHYDAYLVGRYEENVLEGYYKRSYDDNYVIPFTGVYGQDYRFTQLRKAPKIDVSGKWEVNFEIETDKPFKAVGEFKQTENHLSGTFLTETGDYRYLDGTIQGDKLYLSTFDGYHLYLFEAKILEDGTLLGSFRAGSNYKALWEGKRNPDFKLASPYSLTFLKASYDKLAFSFPNTAGKMISLNDEAYKGKKKIIQIFGSWCPNCADETTFLVDYLKANPNDNLAVIGLAYERHGEFGKASTAVERMKKRFDVPYEMLVAGTLDKEAAAKTLPMLNAVISFPTLIFLDENDKVLKIHTGFSGPATSEYATFVEEFKALVK